MEVFGHNKGMKTLDLESLNQKIEEFTRERDWDQFHSVKNLTMALNVECGELMEIFQWMSEADSNSAKHHPGVKAKVEDEVADVFVYLLRIISKLDIELEQAVKRKMLKNAQKYPVEKARGSAKKYDEF